MQHTEVSIENACLTTVYTPHRLRLFLSRDLLRDLLFCLVLSLLLLLMRFFLLSSLSCLLLLDLLTRSSGDLDLLLPPLSLLLPLLLLFTSLSLCLTERLRLLLSFLDDRRSRDRLLLEDRLEELGLLVRLRRRLLP